jgi:hypothetical protein
MNIPDNKVNTVTLSAGELAEVQAFERQINDKYHSDIYLIAVDARLAELSPREAEAIKEFQAKMSAKYGKRYALLAVEAVPDVYFT